MASNKLTTKSFLPANAKVVLVSSSLLFLVIFLLAVVFKVGISKTSSQRTKLQTAEKKERVLSQKQKFLQEIENDVLSYTDVATLAMPEKNPALTIISQLKTLADESLVTLTNFDVGNPTKDKKGLNKVTVSFEVEGELSQVLGYLNLTKDIAPIALIERADVTQVAGTMRAAIDLVSYWVPLPTKLPAITEPVKELTADEINLISTLSSLRQPIFTEVLPTTSEGRSDPFNY